MMRAIRSTCFLLASLALAGCSDSDPLSGIGGIGSQHTGQQWISAWGATKETEFSFTIAPKETTVRNIARITAGGNTVRLRFFNMDTERTVHIGAAALGIRQPGTDATLIPESNRAVTFNGGQSSAIIPPNTPSFYSDPVQIEVKNQDDLAISLYVVGSNNADEFAAAWNESYKLPNDSGDATMDESGNGFGLIDGMPFQLPPGTPVRCMGCRPYVLRDVEIITSEATGAILFLGSSSFHGANTSQNQFKRISDLISVRMLNELPAGQRHTVVNRAISGDTLEATYATRMETDVWSTQGLRSIVVWVTNDLADRTADEIIGSYRSLIADAHSRDVKVYCPTWLPGVLSLQASLNGERNKLNDWILNSGECDGVADYNAAVEAPGGLTFLPQYNGGDFIHSNDAGHALWADITPLRDWVLDQP